MGYKLFPRKKPTHILRPIYFQLPKISVTFTGLIFKKYCLLFLSGDYFLYICGDHFCKCWLIPKRMQFHSDVHTSALQQFKHQKIINKTLPCLVDFVLLQRNKFVMPLTLRRSLLISQQFCTHRLLIENDLIIFPIFAHAHNKNAILHLRIEILPCRNAVYKIANFPCQNVKYFLKKTQWYKYHVSFSWQVLKNS